MHDINANHHIKRVTHGRIYGGRTAEVLCFFHGLNRPICNNTYNICMIVYLKYWVGEYEKEARYFNNINIYPFLGG